MSHWRWRLLSWKFLRCPSCSCCLLLNEWVNEWVNEQRDWCCCQHLPPTPVIYTSGNLPVLFSPLPFWTFNQSWVLRRLLPFFHPFIYFILFFYHQNYHFDRFWRVVFTLRMPYWLLTLMTSFCNQNKIQTIFKGWLLPTSSPTSLPFDCIFLLAIYSSLCQEYFPSDFSDRITPTHFLKPQLYEAFPGTLLC